MCQQQSATGYNMPKKPENKGKTDVRGYRLLHENIEFLNQLAASETREPGPQLNVILTALREKGTYQVSKN